MRRGRTSGRRAGLLSALALLFIPPWAASSQALPETGTASWYGDPFHGRKTANGELFDKGAMTAAHKTIPFGTVVIVTNKSNGRRVAVRINDRGPFVGTRVIDLSEAAAAAVGLIASGTATVTIDFAPPGTALGPYGEGGAVLALPGSRPPAAGQPGVTVIQVASFEDDGNAARLLERLRLDGIDATVESAGRYRRVIVVTASERADRIAERLRNLGYRSLWIRSTPPAKP